MSKARIAELKTALRTAELELQKAQGLVTCVFETDGYFNAQKHGHAYVAIITHDEHNRPWREFLDDCVRVYDKKHKYYKARWEAELPVGTKVEARLEDGSWKNDYRDYFIVAETGLRRATREEVLGL